ncbi:flagellar export protein FliJ [Marinimicrobium sp. C2-29]|uniref:flagellar export protein FliJ n=1 Tax=Marinimicrobium sp. C2-29 TaxID=3139825 RepID=UPI0031395736
MAERRSERLRVVVMLAEREEQAAAARLGEQRALLENEQAQLGQLEDYRNQYVEDYHRLRHNVQPEMLMSYSGFLQRLGQALEGQQQRLAQVQQGMEQRREEWQQKYHRRRSLEDLVTRLAQEENSVLEQKLQRELDDLAAQRFSRDQGSY